MVVLSAKVLALMTSSLSKDMDILLVSQLLAPGFHFDMDALKILVGQGDLYVRLTRDVDTSVSDSRFQ